MEKGIVQFVEFIKMIVHYWLKRGGASEEPEEWTGQARRYRMEKVGGGGEGMGPPASASLLRSPQRGDGAVLRPAEQSGNTCPGWAFVDPSVASDRPHV